MRNRAVQDRARPLARVPARATIFIATLVFLIGPATSEGSWVERIDRARRFSTRDGFFRTELSALFDLEGYYVDQRPPGLIFGSNNEFVNPRLSLFLDTHLGAHLYSFVQARIDRGFDPRSRSSSARFDEYLVRYTPFDEPWVNLQVGKFATMVGNWVPRHDSWTNPFITAPLPYENITIVSDVEAPTDPAAFLARRRLSDRKRRWVPVVWGPSYTSGAAIFGRARTFEYAAEVKNASLSSRPAEWDGTNRGWGDPTVSGRFGWRPSARWAFGTSASSGPYLQDKARGTLPPGADVDDSLQTTFGLDASYAWRHWQLWAEFFASRFEVPNVDDADTAVYYVEGRYKATPALCGALRWNQQFFGEVHDGQGHERVWDRDIWRLDSVVGYRLGRHVQAKLQYSYSHQRGDRQQGEQLLAAQMTFKF